MLLIRYVLNGSTMTGKVSDYVNVDVATNPSPRPLRPDGAIFHLTDNNGQPVNDATIAVQGIMPTHGHVTEVRQMDNSAGAYTANLLMPMSGGWTVELTITRPGHDTVVSEVSLDLATSELRPHSLPEPKHSNVRTLSTAKWECGPRVPTPANAGRQCYATLLYLLIEISA